VIKQLKRSSWFNDLHSIRYSSHLPGSRVVALEMAPMPVQELVLGLRATKVRHHLWGVRLPQQAQVSLRPRF
jgi:hypothetical protein